ncbi:hypothetical protein [Paraherbaspirillum soli]|uniref:Uncharacterized protein n=1 Tax=Paraherbaspirillum soli TaxID=631222 RepID=A0ABW0MDL3_9BURK
MADPKNIVITPEIPNDSLHPDFALICRDIGFEVGTSLKPQRKAQLFSALADLNALALELRGNTRNPSLNGFLDGVITALEE